VPNNTFIKTKWICRCGKEFCNDYQHIKRKQLCESCRSEKVSGPNHHNWNPDREKIKIKKKIQSAYSRILRNVLRETRSDKTSRTEKMLGYSIQEFKIHIESKFETWMNWENNGKPYKSGEERKWSIDHIKSIQEFIKNTIYNPKIINALSNLRPLDANENLKKSDYMENGKRARDLLDKSIPPNTIDALI
jgi:hypothetical protein